MVDKLSTQFRVGRERHWVHCVSSAAAPYYSNLAMLGGELQTLLIPMLRLPRAGSEGKQPGKQILIFQGRLAGARRGSEGKKLVKQEEKQQNSVKINPHQGT